MENLFSHMGVRIFILNSQNKLLLVKHKVKNENKEFWILPGGGVEENEYSFDAAIREVKEETNLNIKIINLLFNLEEKTKNGLRCTNYFLGEHLSGKIKLGTDPEFDRDNQVLSDIKYFTKEEIMKLPDIYPELIRDEFWDIVESYNISHNVWRKRPSKGFSKV